MIRNFINTLKRYKLSSSLNILGLAVAIASSYILLVQSTFEIGYNKELKDANRLFRLEQSFFKVGSDFSDDWSAPLARIMLDGNPTVQSYHFGHIKGRAVSHCFEKIPEMPALQLMGLEFTESAFDALGFEIIEGNLEPTIKRQGVVISRSTARKYDVKVGDLVSWGDSYNPAAAQPVSAIFKDFPHNSDLAGLQVAFGDYWNKIASDNYNEWNNPCYVKLRTADDVEAFYDVLWVRFNEDESLTKQMNQNGITRENIDCCVRLTPFAESYFSDNEIVKGELAIGNSLAVYTMFSMAILVLLLAFINFFNFYVALIPKRIRSINIQKIIGAGTLSLRISIVFEALMMAVLAVGLAVLLVRIVALSDFTSLLATTLDFEQHLPIVVTILCGVSLSSVVTAIYPAWYLTSFSPAFVLKGSFGASSSGKMLRNALIGIQFVVAFIFILVASFIFLQYRYMQRYDMGFDKENVIVFNLGMVSSDHTLAEKRETVRSAFMSNPDILDVAFGYEDIVKLGGMSWGRPIRDGEVISFKVYPVHYNFLKVMGIDIVEGRNFTEDDARCGNRYIFNMAAKKKYNLSLGETVPGTVKKESSEIIGFCEDFNFRPLQYPLEPYAFYIFPPHDEWRGCGVLYVKTRPGSNFAELSKFIKDECMKLNPKLISISEEPKLLEQQLADSFYEKEYNQFVVVALFSFLSIVIALLGVFGLVFFETQYRSTEIAIRRVNGALVSDILWMFNARFVKILALCFAVAVPVATYFMIMWLQEFAFKTPLYIWVYALDFFVVALFVIGIVVVSSWRVVTRNPIEVVNNVM